MQITRQDLAKKLIDYLHHRITQAELVSWAESAMMAADFDEKNFETLRDITARLGLADVKQFGLTWEECKEFLSRLGYHARVEVSEVA